MAMHKIPDTTIYLGSLFALRGRQSLQDAGITHILSVLQDDIEPKLAEGFTHMHVQLQDDEDEDILKHFDKCHEFIRSGLESGGAVLVHCVAGISRSATIVTSYIMKTRQLTAPEALAIVQQGRERASPNPSFLEQLDVYYNDGLVVSEALPNYRRWKLRKDAEIATAAGAAPRVVYAPDRAERGIATAIELRCKKCRCPLSTGAAIIPHSPRPTSSSQQLLRSTKIGPGMVSVLQQGCNHYFLDPVRWMKPELEKGELEGKFDCPKCNTKIGSYRWQGMQCTCGEWVTPGISVQRGRVDEVRIFASKA
ncbi:protein-tyrosine phosphatase-like protein [Limtongia smithiae]|uniref:protein-tyrosine phosphatase-like protein n=1 Tax=Limtongia smithiae TaxID=1125753 RepID=UPI0034CF8ABF